MTIPQGNWVNLQPYKCLKEEPKTVNRLTEYCPDLYNFQTDKLVNNHTTGKLGKSTTKKTYEGGKSLIEIMTQSDCPDLYNYETDKLIIDHVTEKICKSTTIQVPQKGAQNT